MQPALGLEPLSGEAQVNAASSGMDAAEGEIGGFPDLDAEIVGGEDRPADMVGSDEEDLAALDRAALDAATEQSR